MRILNSAEGRLAEREKVSKVTPRGVGSAVRAAESPRAR